MSDRRALMGAVSGGSHDPYHLKLTNSDYDLVAATCDFSRYNTAVVDTSYANRRRMLSVSSGVKPFVNRSDGSDSIYYPVPIPDDVTSMTVTITPSTQYISPRVGKYNEETDLYTCIVDSTSWSQGSVTRTFTASANLYCMIVFKYNSGGISYPDEPTEITLDFE